jgi:peroxiredoxin
MTAPDFTLTDQNGDDWTLSDHLDAAVVLFFLRGDW